MIEEALIPAMVYVAAMALGWVIVGWVVSE